MSRESRAGLGLAATAAVMAALVLPAQASFPGTNGKVAFTEANQVFTMNPDGSSESVLLADPPRRNDPAWSPDGTKLAYRRGAAGAFANLAVVNADGTNDHEITTAPDPDTEPAWSPDGSKIVFARRAPETGREELFVIDAEGGGETQITFDIRANNPSWSPDGTRIAFERWMATWPDIWTMNPDGTGAVNLTNTPDVWENAPDWSPDGSRILYSVFTEPRAVRVMNSNGTGDAPLVSAVMAEEPDWSPDGTKIIYDDAAADIYVANSDGSGATLVRAHNHYTTEQGIDWRPIPINSYPRPKGATPTRVSLVPAYLQCTDPNRIHGPPLEFASCGRPTGSSFGPPTLTSQNLIVGTPDHNGRPANSAGYVLLQTLVGNPTTPADEADVQVEVSVTDVRCSLTIPPALCDPPSANPATNDYIGELEVRLGLRITDKNNTPTPGGGSGAATVQDTTLSLAAVCSGDGSQTVGSTCSATTTIEAVVPGAVAEGKRAIWELAQVQVFDGGADGDADTADNSLFMTQGVFVP